MKSLYTCPLGIRDRMVDGDDSDGGDFRDCLIDRIRPKLTLGAWSLLLPAVFDTVWCV